MSGLAPDLVEFEKSLEAMGVVEVRRRLNGAEFPMRFVDVAIAWLRRHEREEAAQLRLEELRIARSTKNAAWAAAIAAAFAAFGAVAAAAVAALAMWS